MVERDCDGWVSSLRGQRVLLTGRIDLGGERTTRDRDLVPALTAHGAVEERDFVAGVTLLVQGSLSRDRVVDPVRLRSQKLRDVHRHHGAGRAHIHIVDPGGLEDLLLGLPARCLTTRQDAGSRDALTLLPQPDAGDPPTASHDASHNNTGDPLGDPLTQRAVTAHDPALLWTDLAALDAGTAAHERTVQALTAHLAARGVTACAPGPGAPKFDLGWPAGPGLAIAEVKSLTGAAQDQQIRLGLGQLLDYSYQLRDHEVVLAVLVLERRPDSDRWIGVAESVGVTLTWGPDFPDV